MSSAGAPERTRLCAVGVIARAVGLKGDVLVRPLTDRRERFLDLTRIYAGPSEAGASEIGVRAASLHQRGVRLSLEGIDDRTRAEAAAGTLLFVPDDERIRLPAGSYFVDDLVGLRVVDQEGRTVGVLKEVLRMPAHDVYVVEREGREAMIPAVKEFVEGIDPAGGVLRVRLIEGMLEG